MAENNVDMLMSVDLDAVETLKTLAELRTKTAGLRQEQRELDRTTKEGAVEYEKLNTQIKANTKTIRSYEQEIVNAITAEKAQGDSIKAMRAELSNAKSAYAELSKAERDSAKGKELLEKTATLNAELKELESAYGDNQRKVGEYENAGKSLRTEMRELTQALVEMKVAGEDGSDEFREMSARLAALKDAMGDVNQQAGQMASDTAKFDTLNQSVQGVIAAYGLWKSTTAALGVENEALDKTMMQLTTVLTALQSLTVLQNLAQKQSNVYRTATIILQKLGLKQTTAEVAATSANAAALTAEAAAENASTVAKTKGVVATKLAAAQQWIWNAAMSANPALLLIVAVLALIAGIAALVGWLNKESDAAKEAASAQEAYNTAMEESEDRLKKQEVAIQNNTREVQLATRKRIEALREEGADEQAIRDAQADGERKVRELEIEYQKQRQRESRDLIALKTSELQYWIKAQDEVREGGKRWREYAERIKEAQDALDGLRETAADADLAIRETMQAQAEAASEAQREAERTKNDAAKAAADAARARVDAAISAYEKELEAQRAYNEARLKVEASYQESDFRSKQDLARRVFELNQSTELARLDNLRKYNRITEAEYARSLAVMQAQLTEFLNGQISEANSFFASEREALMGMLTQTIEEQIAAVEKKYTEAIDRMSAIEPPTMLAGEDPAAYAARLREYEVFALEQVNIAIRLEEQRDAEIARLRESSLSWQMKQIEDAAKMAYADDLMQHQGNERAKLEITEKMLREQIAAKKAAGIQTYEDEAQLDDIALRRAVLNLNRDLILAGDNAKKRYDAKAAALNAELALVDGNADRQLEIARDLADAERELVDARIAAFGEWRDTAGEVFDSFTTLMSNNLDAQLQKTQETYDRETLALADKYARGLLTEAQYTRETIKLDQQRAKEEAKIERQRAIRERAGKVFSVVTDTAMGVVKAVAASPLTGGLPWSAIVSAIGALNLATILSEPLPKAARGGLIIGPSHRAGGTVIEAEGGEAIMSKRAVSMFGPILSALNQLGGGIPFTGVSGDGGYIARSVIGGGGASAAEIAEAVKDIRIYTTVEDINRGHDQYAKIQARGSIL